MEFQKLKDRILNSENLNQDFIYIGATLVIAILTIGVSNFMTPDSPVEVGYVEVYTECTGIDAGVCLGVQTRNHRTFNYDDYQKVEPGTDNFYRRVESELMIRAYNTCNENITGMEWTDQVEYRNKTASEWMENENVQLLPCEQTFYREMEASQ